MSYYNESVHLSSAGNYGGMPQDSYLRKIATSNVHEDPHLVENYFRNTLTDLTPVPPNLAYEQPRRNKHSREFLSLRHTATRGGGEDPYLPDGTFLDHEFTERDPRGHAIGPNMREGVKQQYARASLIKLYDDSDYSIPSEGINPEEMRRNIRGGQQIFKNQYSNFDTSFDSRHNGYNMKKRSGGSDVSKYTMDGTLMDITDAEQGNRRDATARLSADNKIAYRHSTPDHRFKITRYGVQKASQFMKDNDWSNNRLSTFQDDSKMVEINGQMVNRQLAHLIINLEGLRQTKQTVAEGAEYGDSHTRKNNSKKLDVNDIHNLMRIDLSTPENANTNLSGPMKIRKIGNKKHNNRKLIANAKLNHEITNSMQQVNKKMKERDVKDLRNHVHQTASDQGIYNESNVRTLRRKFKNNGRESQDNRHIEKSKEVINYAGIKPSKTNRTDNMVVKDLFGSHSLNTLNRKTRKNGIRNTNANTHQYEQDRDRLDFGVFDRASRADRDTHRGRRQTSMDKGDTEVNDSFGEVDLQMSSLI
jgi:hypothetical protein